MCVAELFYERATLCVDVVPGRRATRAGFVLGRAAKRRGFVLGEMRRGPRSKIAREGAMRVLEERPGEMIWLAQNQFPSNFGVCFSTNARYARSKSAVCIQSACVCASASIASSMLMLHS